MTQTRRLELLDQRGRRGVTLIEMLVVMAIITALGLLALMLLPGINNSDAALKGTEEVRATCKVAQALANGARQPRGVRILYTPGAPLGNRYGTELQLLEAPPVTVLDPLTLVAPAGGNLNAKPYVQFEYTLDANQAITSRVCKVFHLTQDQVDQVKTNGILALPTLGFWARIAADPAVTPDTTTGTFHIATGAGLVLDFYPDSLLGASTVYRTYHVGVFGPPVPLLGQPTIPLPKNIGVDLDVSAPASTGAGNYDIMFAPDGQTISVAGTPSNAGVYLWVRDVTKIVNPNPVGGGSPTSMVPAHFGGRNAAWADAFRRGGEQHAVGINNGYVGTAQIQWPDANGTYAQGDEFTFARKRLQ